MIKARYEKGNKFLDLSSYSMTTRDDDGLPVTDTYWACEIYTNTDKDFNAHETIKFANEVSAKLFIDFNGWKEQCL